MHGDADHKGVGLVGNRPCSHRRPCLWDLRAFPNHRQGRLWLRETEADFADVP
jgi:hypothetical protein